MPIKTWFLTLLKAIKARFSTDTPELRAMNGLFAPSLDDDILAHMVRAGFKILNLALITTHTGQLKRFNRPNTAADMDRVLALAQKHGLDAVAYIIVAGPSQDPHDSLKDLLFLAQRPVLAGLSVFYPAPGSPDYHWCRRQHLLPPQTTLMRATALPLVDACDRLQAVTLLRLGTHSQLHEISYRPGPETAPIPTACPGSGPLKMEDRRKLGILLLAAFLKDGTILRQ